MPATTTLTRPRTASVLEEEYLDLPAIIEQFSEPAGPESPQQLKRIDMSFLGRRKLSADKRNLVPLFAMFSITAAELLWECWMVSPSIIPMAQSQMPPDVLFGAIASCHFTIQLPGRGIE